MTAFFKPVLWAGFFVLAGVLPASAACLDCHQPHALDESDPHAFLAQQCQACHLGEVDAANREDAHAGMISSPGWLDNAAETCGTCHVDETRHVVEGLMHSGRGMVNVTRHTVGEQDRPDQGDGRLDGLGHTPADSILRKHCASCHLGQPQHQMTTEDPIGSRGGGCLACHAPHETQRGQGHVTLSATVSDQSCSGCHSRSGRIALNYAGLAEVDAHVLDENHPNPLGRLPDGRLVESTHRDVHHQAGLACIDCHTTRDVMGPTGQFNHGSDAVDIQCADCHDNRQPRITEADWPSDLRGQLGRLPFERDPQRRFLTTERRSTPLWHIELRADGSKILHRKVNGGSLPIPPLTEASHPDDGHHDRLTCSTCHTQWAPQCHGCHMDYDPEKEQFDHVAREFTPGSWSDQRWNVHNDAPPMGVDSEGHIVTFVPGMIRTIDHPDWEQTQFRRYFAPLSPHTIGPARSCEDCHRSSQALGLGRGTLEHNGDEWVFNPNQADLQDGLPADAFVDLEGRSGRTTRAGARALTAEEIQRVLNALPP
ncbi:hypothetical protein [Wenzhouxiangella limi]|uniref:Uncharacterized protein n=1 Tax=Wenzhouxiangella limi TaxID=2707351 RepID=A0A845UVL5_9GAMM|nr:hypothetical protein [Wenzhouxiangella limi]NDY94628.1 hypothetical protein [Wenzhouxiangella limi]